MRVSKIFIGLLALLLASCSVPPRSGYDNKAELSKLKGPETGSVEGSMHDQAEQAAAQGDYKRSAQIYKQLVDKSPDNIGYQLGYAEALRRSGMNEASLRVSDTVIAKDPKNAVAYENKALALMNTGEFAEAGTAFGQVMEIDPKRWRTLNGIGILFAMKGKYDNAIKYFQAALNVSTDNASVLNNAALTYAIDKQFDRAYDAFARAKRHLDPGSADLKHLDLNLALVYAVDGKLDAAEATAAQYLSKEALYNNMGFYSYLAKNNEMAKTYLNMALTQSPTYYERAWKNLGALTGDVATGEAPQPIPGIGAPPPDTALPEPSQSHGEIPLSAIPAAAAPSAGVPLSDIPESRTLHADGSESVTAPAPPLVKSEDVASKHSGGSTKDAGDAKPNPDIVLSKPKNSDWDAKDNLSDKPVTAIPDNVTPSPAPAATPGGTAGN